jgi:NADH:ubiquinone oxidoreductase subunit 3 (subunit A)
MVPEAPEIDRSDRTQKDGVTMGLIFNILAILNYVGCVLTLTLFILYYRKPIKKNSPLEVSKEKAKFKERWIIMLWWISGTLMIAVFNLNILFILPWVIIGAYSATFMSGYPNSENRDLGPSPLKPQLESSSESPDSKRRLIQQEMSPAQAALLPDLGKHLARKGAPQNTMTVYPSFTIKEIAVVGLGRYCITKVQEIEGELYCGTFDFGKVELESILAHAVESTRDAVAGSLMDDPQSVRHISIPNPVHVGIKAVLGKPQQGIDETFIPLVITEVFPPR